MIRLNTKVLLSVVSMLLLILVSNTYASQYIVSANDYPITGPSEDSKELLVKFKEDNSELIKESVKKRLKLTNLKLKKKLNFPRLELLEIGLNDDINLVAHEFEKSSLVEYAQPNYKLYSHMIPNDKRFNEQWGLNNVGQTILGQKGSVGIDIKATRAWDVTTGNPMVVIGILDSGVDISHIDISSNIYSNPKEIPNNNVDDDGNGYTDDIFGWDFFNNDDSVFDENTLDAHGTHVTGIIAATSNTEGISGVAPNIKVLPLKFLSGNYGYTSGAIEAIVYAKSLGIEIINCSWGGTTYNKALEDAMMSSNILFVCSAGNNGTDVTINPNYPTCFNIPNIISVAAIDITGLLSISSNYGSKVSVTAPGVNILSTIPGNIYEYQSGTSMAAPFVTGIAALIKSKSINSTYLDIISKIKNNVKITKSLRGKVSTSGIVDAYSSIATP